MLPWCQALYVSSQHLGGDACSLYGTSATWQVPRDVLGQSQKGPIHGSCYCSHGTQAQRGAETSKGQS